ncbi:MAG: M20/M25/M40 family metallo-hydrolase [Actinomycetota bacterium]
MEPHEQARHRRVDLLGELVTIPSVNPLQAGERSGPGGEQAMAERVAELADGLGADVLLDEVEAGRPNVYATFPGSGAGHVVVDVHIDTVGVEHMEGDPFSGECRDDRVYGRGAVDTKASLAVVFDLMERVRAGHHTLGPTLTVVGTVAEEAGGLAGAHRFHEWAQERRLHVDRIVVAEPTMCAPVHGHKGGVGLEITVRGTAAHSSRPELGRNAIRGAARIIEAFDTEHERLVSGPADTAVGPGTLSVTQIGGGLARNIIPDQCWLYAGRRTAPGEDPDAVFAALAALAIDAAEGLEVEVEKTYGRGSPAFYQDPDAAIVTDLADWAGSEPTTATYGSNALVYPDIADGVVVFGPGSIDQAHGAVEWVTVDELDRAAAVYQRWLTEA